MKFDINMKESLKLRAYRTLRRHTSRSEALWRARRSTLEGYFKSGRKKRPVQSELPFGGDVAS